VVLIGRSCWSLRAFAATGPTRRRAPATLDELVAELQSLRKEIKKGGDKTPVWQKVVLRGVSAAGSAGGAYAAKRLVDRQEARAAA